MVLSIFIILLFLVALLFAHAFNLQATAVAIAKRLSPDYKLPPISLLDSLTRNGQTANFGIFLGSFLIFSLLLILYIAIFMDGWHILLSLSSPILLFFTIVLCGAIILPAERSDFYIEQVRRGLMKLQIHYHKKGNNEKEKEADEILELINRIASDFKVTDVQILPSGPLSQEERRATSKLQVYLVWYDDKFESEGTSSFLHAVCLTEQEAQEIVNRRPLHAEGNWGDGYAYQGSSNLLQAYDSNLVSEEQVRQLLRGESPTGPKYS